MANVEEEIVQPIRDGGPTCVHRAENANRRVDRLHVLVRTGASHRVGRLGEPVVEIETLVTAEQTDVGDGRGAVDSNGTADNVGALTAFSAWPAVFEWRPEVGIAVAGAAVMSVDTASAAGAARTTQGFIARAGSAEGAAGNGEGPRGDGKPASLSRASAAAGSARAADKARAGSPEGLAVAAFAARAAVAGLDFVSGEGAVGDSGVAECIAASAALGQTSRSSRASRPTRAAGAAER